MNSLSAHQLQQFKAFNELSIEDCEALLAIGQAQHMQKGETLFHKHDNYTGSLFLVYSGKIEVQRPGGEIITAAAGDFIGLSNYIDKSPFNATAIAQSDVDVLVFPETPLTALEQSRPAIADTISRIITKRIRQRGYPHRIESGPLAEPVRTVMTSPLSTCHIDLSLADAFHLMDSRKIGSLGVLDDNDKLFGVLTYAGLAEAMITKGAKPESKLSHAACETPRTVNLETPIWQASDLLARYNTKYLIVTEDDHPVGLMSQSDVLKSLITTGDHQRRRIQTFTSCKALKQLYDELYLHARVLLHNNRYASQAIRLLSYVHLNIQQRVIELTLQQIEAKQGPAPCAYAVLIMGSGGRQEMLLTPDQDNGIIIDDRSETPSDSTLSWFKDFAELLNQNLAEAGYILCPGDIMARNPQFHKTLSQWRKQFTHMVDKPNLKAAKWSNIVFDFDTLYGDDSLTYALRQHLLAAIQNKPQLLEFMVEHDAEGKPAIGLFNRLLTTDNGEEKGSIDIKRNGLRIIADAARVYALSAGISSCNTQERLKRLVHRGILSADLVESVSFAYDELLDMLLQHQIEQAEQQHAIDKFIYPAELNEQKQSVLRVSMRAIKRLQDKLQGQYGRSAF